MFEFFLGGIYLGIILSITLGPTFFTIIQTSIDRGFYSAFQISIGVMVADIILIFISFLGITTILEVGKNQIYLAIIASVILILFGFYTFFKKPEMLKRRSANYKTPTSQPGALTYLGKGFLLNIANPFLWIFWVAALTGLSAKTEPENFKISVITFFSGTILIVFCLDVLKSYIGVKIKKYLKLRYQIIINRIVGVSLILFGIFIFVKTIFF